MNWRSERQQWTAELVAANEQLHQEITERKRIEEALAEEHNLLRTLIDNLPDSIYIKDTPDDICWPIGWRCRTQVSPGTDPWQN